MLSSTTDQVYELNSYLYWKKTSNAQMKIHAIAAMTSPSLVMFYYLQLH